VVATSLALPRLPNSWLKLGAENARDDCAPQEPCRPLGLEHGAQARAAGAVAVEGEAVVTPAPGEHQLIIQQPQAVLHEDAGGVAPGGAGSQAVFEPAVLHLQAGRQQVGAVAPLELGQHSRRASGLIRGRGGAEAARCAIAGVEGRSFVVAIAGDLQLRRPRRADRPVGDQVRVFAPTVLPA
jgi:hypothetical protein